MSKHKGKILYCRNLKCRTLLKFVCIDRQGQATYICPKCNRVAKIKQPKVKKVYIRPKATFKQSPDFYCSVCGSAGRNTGKLSLTGKRIYICGNSECRQCWKVG